jgi:hypothetical protein
MKYVRQVSGHTLCDHTLCNDLKTSDLQERIQNTGLSCTNISYDCNKYDSLVTEMWDIAEGGWKMQNGSLACLVDDDDDDDS